MIAGCTSKEPTPEERFADYVQLWNEQKFADMYKLLSEQAKDSVTKEAFVDRYHKIYQDLEIDKLEVQFEPPEETEKYDAEASFPFAAKMDSVAGPIDFTHTAKLVKETREDSSNWYIDWDTTYIFPELGANDRIRYQNISAERGKILDRRENGLAINGTAMQIGVVPGKLGESSVQQLSDLLEMAEEEINKQLNASWVKPDLFVPLKTVSKNDGSLREELFAIEGVTTMEVGAREYPYGEALSHLVGYIAPVTAEDLERNEGKGYSAGDYIGKRGLEQVFEGQLKGTNGVKISVAKEDGSEKVLAEKPVEHGKDVQLTIDVVLQQRVYDQLNGVAGTAAAIHPLTGETLALVSAPGFDPNAEVLGNSRAMEEDDPLQPYLNRFRLSYVPGSVIKPMTAVIALANDKIELETSFEITEKQWQPDRSWGDYKVTRYTNLIGQVDLEKAMIFSDNIYFARTALEIGKDGFADGLRKFGFEDIDYPYPLEASQIGELANDIALADSGYGQGQVEMNILHLAATYTPFLNNGNMLKPILLMEEEQKQVWAENLISPEEAAALDKMLTKVVTETNGTAHVARMEGVPLAGKTGTAEIKGRQGERGRELGWFVAYNTDLLVSLMIEDVQTGEGSKEAVTRVRNLFSNEGQ
nr:penicillin-binding transpeptidase domain-containing protein [Bacillus sp. B15-48]